MNERIRELAVQARQEFLELPTGYTAEQVGMYPQLMERFAELIVIECAKQLDVYKMMKLDSSFYSSMLREHFGVKR